MIYSLNNIEDFALPLPITQTARKTAQKFASQQRTPQKAEQVRLNTLAVCVVNDYLQMIGVPTDITAGDSWNPIVRLCANVADLEVTGVGRLECLPLGMQEQSCDIQPEVWSDRIGYVMVQINESLRQVKVLGFAPTAVVRDISPTLGGASNCVSLSVRQLRPIEDLIEHLHPQTQPVAAAASIASSKMVNLSQWLENVFETSWQTVEALLNPAASNLAFSFRSDLNAFRDTGALDTSVRRARLIDLGIQLAGYPVALIVEVRPESEQKTNILLQVQPTGSQTYLPPRLQLIVLDESGAIFLEAQARSTDDYIQLEFSGTLGEQFSVKVALGDASITENFVL